MASKKPMAKQTKKIEKNKKTKTPAPLKAKPKAAKTKPVVTKTVSKSTAKKAPAKKAPATKAALAKPLGGRGAVKPTQKGSTPAKTAAKPATTQKPAASKPTAAKSTSRKTPASKVQNRPAGKTVSIQTVKKTVKPSQPGGQPIKLTKTAPAAPTLPPVPAVDISAMDLAEMEPPPPLSVRVNDVIADDEMATLREMEANNEAIKRARENAKIRTPIGWDGVHCHECDGDIEPVRLRLGYYHCIGCATELEKIAKIYGNQG